MTGNPSGTRLRSPAVALDATAADGHVRISWKCERPASSLLLYRSTSDLSSVRRDMRKFPVARFEIADSSSGSYVDLSAADNTLYYYQAVLGASSDAESKKPPGRTEDQADTSLASAVVSVRTPDRPLPSLSRPSLRVDKRLYVLEALDGDRVVKRYPIALGGDPVARKLHQDNATTPEGHYYIQARLPGSIFSGAYSISYPGSADQVRYRVAREAGRLGLPGARPGIGNGIQLHGHGVRTNWTLGCVALRNEDMAELLSHPEITAGTPVSITGSELTREDLSRLSMARTGPEIRAIQSALAAEGLDPGPFDGKLGSRTMEALGRFQLRHGLPLTCEPDALTSARLLRTDGQAGDRRIG